MTDNYDELYLNIRLSDYELAYRFNRKTGVVQISMSQSDLEEILTRKRLIDADGQLELALPFDFNVIKIVLNGVKRIESLPNIKSYLFEAKKPKPQEAHSR